MKSRQTKFHPVQASLKDVLGNEYVKAVCAARACLSGEDLSTLQQIASTKIDFFPKTFHEHLLALLSKVGTGCVEPLTKTLRGATSAAFAANTHTELAPLSTLWFYRLGEDGRLFLISKSEHYHAALGHGFPGYGLLEHARRLGIPNATHNNTRGFVSRRLEEELVRAAAGLSRKDEAGLYKVLASTGSTDLNRVLNLDTGSLAAEAAIKMVLSRFYLSQPGSPEPKYKGRTPVFVVIGDDQGGLTGNYHGTTLAAQIMRGMWSDLLAALEQTPAFLVRCIRPNALEELESVFDEYEEPPYKIAGMFHELVMMNYGARRLTETFVRKMYSWCRKHDVPTVVDEIQTCAWSPEMFLFREYGVQPSIAVVGKGFPGGEFSASRILFNASGQRHSSRIMAVEGRRHMLGITFEDVEAARQFTKRLNRDGLDISVQTYKEGCPPSALTKLPLIAGYEVIDFILERMESALQE